MDRWEIDSKYFLLVIITYMHAHLMSTSDNHTSYSVAVVQFEFLILVPAELSNMVQYVAIYVFLKQPASCFLSAPLALCISPGQPQDALDLWLNCPNQKKKKPDWLCSAPHCLFQMFPSCTSSLSNKTENLNKIRSVLTSVTRATFLARKKNKDGFLGISGK